MHYNRDIVRLEKDESKQSYSENKKVDALTQFWAYTEAEEKRGEDRRANEG
jgi:hypothetical protein